MSEDQELSITTRDGFSLYALAEIPEHANATVILCHGITSDHHEGGLFDGLAKAFTAEGFCVVRFDYRGHGKSSGSSLDVSLEGEQTDLSAVYTALRDSEKFPGRFAVVAGSFSCASAIRLSLSANLCSLVLVNPVFDYFRTFIKPETPWGRGIEGTLNSPSLPVGARAEIPKQDFLISTKLWEEMERDITPVIAERLKVPTIAFHGDKDQKVPLQPLVDFARKNPGTMKLRIVPGEDHGLKATRPQVISETVNWVSSHCSPEDSLT